MRFLRLTGCTLAAAALAAPGAIATGVAKCPDSGVRGRVLYGPTCPVQRPGQSCERPYQASITIKRQPAGTIVVHVRSDARGRFTARLKAGSYLLQPQNGKPFPRAQPQTVSVHSHRFTAVTIRFDSGIR